MNEVFAVGVPTLAVLSGILVNNSRLSDMQRHLDQRLDDLKDLMNAKFETARADLIRVEQVVDARLKRLEDLEKH
jgi:hypothetical protein